SLKVLAYADNVYILLFSRTDFFQIQDYLDSYKRATHDKVNLSKMETIFLNGVADTS
ncbi:hypothetical protein BCV71DRAFT_188028, partial [Rhizopus microsporus]